MCLCHYLPMYPHTNVPMSLLPMYPHISVPMSLLPMYPYTSVPMSLFTHVPIWSLILRNTTNIYLIVTEDYFLLYERLLLIFGIVLMVAIVLAIGVFCFTFLVSKIVIIIVCD